MIVDESISNIERTVRHLRAAAGSQSYSEHPAVVAAPQWFVDEVKRAFADQMVEATDEVDQLAGCKLVVRDDIEEPFTIAADGTLYPALPGWAREANRGRAV